MSITNNQSSHFHTDQSWNHENGDVGVREEHALECPETESLNSNTMRNQRPPEAGPSMGAGPATNPNEANRNLTHATVPDGTTLSQIDINMIEIERLEMRREKLWQGLGKKQGIKIASMNMKGRRLEGKKDKWPLMATMIRKSGISILAVQETHLDEEKAAELEKYKSITVISNGSSTRSRGVGFILNNDLIKGKIWKHTIIIPDQVSRLQIEWDREEGLDIFCVYAPSTPADKENFYKLLYKEIAKCEDVTSPIIMGDFNMVEEEIDRFPRRPDKPMVRTPFQKIMKKWNLVDGWRIHHPDETDYTFFGESMSRIDRIYMHDDLYPYAYNWYIKNSGGLSDHNMVVTEILNSELPYIGQGIWRFKLDLLENNRFCKKLIEMGKKVKGEVADVDEKRSKQRIWSDFKLEIQTLAKNEAKQYNKERNKDRTKLEREMAIKLKSLSKEAIDIEKERKNDLTEEVELLRDQIGKAKRKEYERLQMRAKARYAKMGEKCTKYWFRLKRNKIPNNVILGLIDKNERLTKSTKEMLNIAVEHHETLQAEPEMTEEREKAIEEITKIIDNPLDENEQEAMGEVHSKSEIEAAIKACENGSAPGGEGLQYEIYKFFITEDIGREDKDKIDMTGTMQQVFEEINTKGIEKLSTQHERRSEFTDGLMFLLYKKKDKRKIENYRPITLLNTDYKIYTKVLATRLGKVAQKRIHPNQAGFVPGRNLFSHTKTTQTMIEYCEMSQENGYIIGLDQEKAYDKIDHEYLWRVLKAFKFPDKFIDRVKEIYRDTDKYINVNGEISRAFKVKRGVHQGDPLSCLLYNFAIEPLAIALRNSEELIGLITPEMPERLIVNLFADDTLVYLHETDDMNILNKIIKTFCVASTAKFNNEKTEYLPIGTQEFRTTTVTTREIAGVKLDESAKIVKDNQAMRTLGAWVGNKIDTRAQWDEIIRKQRAVLEMWKKDHLSFRGKELILKALIQSRAVFLATVNGMPQDVEKEMQEMYRNFVWDGRKKGLMAWNKIIAPREIGGLNMPDLKSRIEAIEIMWTKKWLAPRETRPTWAYIVDDILFQHVAKAPMVENCSKQSWILQTWNEKDTAEISQGIRSMLKVARKYNITWDVPKVSLATKEKMPIWHSIMINDNYLWNKKAAKKLRAEHRIKTVGDIWDLETNPDDCRKHAPCKKMIETIKRKVPRIINPNEQTPRRVRKLNLDHTPNRISMYKDSKGYTCFNPDISARGDPEEEIRIFADQKGVKTRGHFIQPREPAYRPTLENIEEEIDDLENGQETTRPMCKLMIVVNIKRPNCENAETIAGIKNMETNGERIIKLQGNITNAMQALIEATRIAIGRYPHHDIHIMTRETTLVKHISKDLKQNENENWARGQNKHNWKQLAHELRNRNAKTSMEVIVKKTPEAIMAKKLANTIRKAKNPEIVIPELIDTKKYESIGARISTMTQKVAYKLALKMNMEDPRTVRSEANIKNIQGWCENLDGRKPTEAKIWTAIAKIEPYRISDYMWKLANDRMKCGPFFARIPGWQDKQFCPCGEVESMEHIIFYCKKYRQQGAWNRIEEFYEKESDECFQRPGIDVLTGISVIAITKENLPNGQITNLYRELVIATAWAIWKARNTRIFSEKDLTETQVIDEIVRIIVDKVRNEWEAVKFAPRRLRSAERVKFVQKWLLGDGIAKLEIKEENGQEVSCKLKIVFGESMKKDENVDPPVNGT